MLPTIENSEKFKTEYNSFKQRIASVTNEKAKSEMNMLLISLLKEVRALDSHHSDLLVKKELPSMVSETRSKVSEVRQNLLRRLEDWERIKPK